MGNCRKIVGFVESFWNENRRLPLLSEIVAATAIHKMVAMSCISKMAAAGVINVFGNLQIVYCPTSTNGELTARLKNWIECNNKFPDINDFAVEFASGDVMEGSKIISNLIKSGELYVDRQLRFREGCSELKVNFERIDPERIRREFIEIIENCSDGDSVDSIDYQISALLSIIPEDETPVWVQALRKAVN